MCIPWYISGPYSQLIRETNQLGDDILLAFNATNNDAGSAGIVNFFNYNTTRPGQFSINETIGHVIVEQSLDYESFTSVNLTLLAIDQGPHMHFSQKLLQFCIMICFWTKVTTLQFLNN